ncbi:MAG: acyltransferase [Myxococcota bacterium]
MQTAPMAQTARIAPAGSFSLVLDACRGLASLAVVFGHARGWFLVDYAAVPNPSILDRGAYFAAFSHEAVIVFFVLSGWLVGGGGLQQIQADTFAPGRYAVQRATRIWVVLVPGMLLSLLLFAIANATGTSVVDAADLGAHAAPAQLATTPAALYGPLTALGNMFGLMTIVVPCYGGNDVLWSLSHEIIFYGLLPLWGLAIFAPRGKWHWGARAALLAGFVAIVVFALPEYYRFTLSLWSISAMVALVAARTGGTLPGPRRLLRAAAWLTFAGSLVLSRLGIVVDLWHDVVVAVTFLGVLVVHRMTPDPTTADVPRNGLGVRAIRGLAAMSYTLYVVHPMVLLGIATAIGLTTRLAPGPASYALLLGAVVAALVVARLIAAVTEARTESVRRYVSRWLPQRAAQTRGDVPPPPR